MTCFKPSRSFATAAKGNAHIPSPKLKVLLQKNYRVRTGTQHPEALNTFPWNSCLHTPSKPLAQARLQNQLLTRSPSVTSRSQPGETVAYFCCPCLTTAGLMPLALTSRKHPESCKTTVRSPLVFVTCPWSPRGFPSQGWGIWGWSREQHRKPLQHDESQPPSLTPGGNTLREHKSALRGSGVRNVTTTVNPRP